MRAGKLNFQDALMTQDHALLPFSWLTLLLFLWFYLLLAFIVFAFEYAFHRTQVQLR